MSIRNNDSSSNDKVLWIPELLEEILLCLDHRDIVIASGVCQFWKDCIAQSQYLRKKIYKLPHQSDADANLHFEDLTESSTTAVIPRHGLRGENLWKSVRECEDVCLSRCHELSDSEWNNAWLEEKAHTYGTKMYNIHARFQGVRWPNGWPRELQLLHCDLCSGWHTNFRFENLHPLFRFLGDISMGFYGHGESFFISLHMVSSDMAPYSCWKDSCEEALYCARHLLKAYKAVEMGAVSKDLFLSPPAIKLVSEDFWCVENGEGLTLDAVVPFMIRLLREHLHHLRGVCHEIQTRGRTRSEPEQRETAATYPTTEDWDRHLAAYSEITTMWEKVVSPAPQFTRYTVNCISRDSIRHLLTHLVVYITALCSSLNTTTFCLLHVNTVLPHPTKVIAGIDIILSGVPF